MSSSPLSLVESSMRSGWIGALARVCRSRSVVLGYHGVGESRLREDPSLLMVPPRRFRSQIEMLLAAGFKFVTLAEMARRASGGVPEPGYAAVTFDDGMRNNHAVALPILQEYDVRATVYVTMDFIDGVSPWLAQEAGGAMMNVSELRDLAAAGWELGAHTITHADLSQLGYEECRAEIEGSRTALEQVAGVDVQTFAYPFGRYGEAARAAAQDAGLLAAVTTGSGRWDRYEMTRAMIGAIDPLPVVLLKLTDRYEPLLASRPMRAVRAASKRLRARAR